MFKYFAVTMAAITLVLSSIMVADALVPKSLSGIAKDIIDEINTPTDAVAGATVAPSLSLTTGGSGANAQVVRGDVRVDGTLHAVSRLCVGEDAGNCKTNLRGEWCGFSGALSGVMDCQGVSLPNCPAGYTYMTIGLASSFGFFGTCIHI